MGEGGGVWFCSSNSLPGQWPFADDRLPLQLRLRLRVDAHTPISTTYVVIFPSTGEARHLEPSGTYNRDGDDGRTPPSGVVGHFVDGEGGRGEGIPFC